MRTIDASSMIHAWDNYPLRQFPPLWRWIAECIHSEDLAISDVALQETRKKQPECWQWLRHEEITRLPVTNTILLKAMHLKTLLEIPGDRYHPRGVGENDLIIIATAREHGMVLISDEAVQPNLPQKRACYKIPAVCAMPEVSVSCMNFVQFVKQSGVIFGA